MDRRRAGRRLVAAVLTVACGIAILAAGTPAVAGDTKSSIAVQEKRLAWLNDLARRKQQRVGATQESVRSLAAEIRRSNATLDALDRRQEQHDARLIDAMANRERLGREMGAVASDMYMRGTASVLFAVMNADELADAGDAVSFTSVVLSRNRRLAERTASAAHEISKVRAQNAALIEQRARVLREQRRRQDDLIEAFAEGQRELEEIVAIRAEVVQLLSRLRRQLRDAELAALGGTMPYGPWAEAFLGSIDAPASRANLVAMVAWQVAEGTLARWNPLATTWRMPGSTAFNGHRVQNYISLEQGLEATRKTLSRPGHGYDRILASLRAGAAAMDTARAINASNWCRGCADGQYVVELIPVVERYYDRYAARRG